MQPMNYMMDVKDPFERSLQGAQAGFAISNIIDKSQQQQFLLQQQRTMQSDLATLSSMKNPTAQDFAAITTKYPQLAEHFKNTWSMLNSDQQQTRLGQATQIYAALNAGQPDIAARLAARQAVAFKNSGQDKDAQAMDTLMQLIVMNPETAKTSTGLMLSSVLGPEKFSSTFSTLAKLPGEIAQGEATATQKTYEANNTPQRLSLENNFKASEIKNLDSTIADRAGRLRLDRDKLQSETELKLYELNMNSNPANKLDGDAKKLINDSTVSSIASNQSATQILDLASRLEKDGGGYGVFGTASEWLKKMTGNQDAMTQMRNEYVRIRNSQVMRSLPPGSASDKDVAFAMGGFPPETADARTMSSFLRGMAKLNQYTSILDGAKAEWVNSVGHLGKPKTDIVVDGVNVPAGTTFAEFTKQYMDAKVQQTQVQQGQEQILNRSYMRHAPAQVAPAQVAPAQVAPAQVDPGQVAPGQVAPIKTTEQIQGAYEQAKREAEQARKDAEQADAEYAEAARRSEQARKDREKAQREYDELLRAQNRGKSSRKKK